jgi:hypothetical protein
MPSRGALIISISSAVSSTFDDDGDDDDDVEVDEKWRGASDACTDVDERDEAVCADDMMGSVDVVRSTLLGARARLRVVCCWE